MSQLRICLLAGAVAFTATAGAADDRNYAFIDLYAVNPSERIPGGDLGFGGRVGLGFPLAVKDASGLAVELGLFANPIEADVGPGGDQAGVMLDLVNAFGGGAIEPFLFAGIGAVMEDLGPVDGTYPAAELGAGLRFGFSDAFKMRVSAGGMAVFNDDLGGNGEDIDGRFNLGFLIPFGAKSMPVAAAPAPAPAPKDSDGDGVSDGRDQCPAVAAPTIDGCPTPVAPPARKDSDQDGVEDNSDECPGTLEGLKVDAKGCAVETGAQSIVLKGVNFLPSSTELTPEAKKVLDQAATALAGQKSLRVELGGHTDSMGDDALNLALSQKRAESVRQYLVSKGVAAERLTAKGYGETQPIADNKTTAGRKSNRRVELKVIR